MPYVRELEINNSFCNISLKCHKDNYYYGDHLTGHFEFIYDFNKLTKLFNDRKNELSKAFQEIKYEIKEKFGEEIEIKIDNEVSYTFSSQNCKDLEKVLDFFNNWHNQPIFSDILFLSEVFEKDFNFISAFRNVAKRTQDVKVKSNYKIEKDGEGYIDQIVEWEKRSNGKIKKLVEVLKALDLIEDISVNRLSGGRFELLVKAKNSKILTSLTNVGFGVSQFLPIIVADLQLSDNSTLFLAEPEIHLHPSIQSKFGEYIVNQVNTTEKNYVIETHSEYFLNRIRLAIVKGELKKEDVKVYFLENNGDDTEVFDIDFTKTGAIKNAPDNFFKTYGIDVMDIALNSFAE